MKKLTIAIICLLLIGGAILFFPQEEGSIISNTLKPVDKQEFKAPQISSGGVEKNSSNSISQELEEGIVEALSTWAVNGSEVYFEDNRAYISATDNTNNPIVRLISKNYNGNINIAFGFNTQAVRPTKASYNRHYENITYAYQCPYDFNYTTGENKEFWCYKTTTYTNSTPDRIDVLFNREYDYGNVSTKTAYWNETKEVWDDISGQFTKTTFFLNTTDTWYYKKNFNVNANQTYELKIDLQPVAINTPAVKYWIAFWPSSKTIKQALEDDTFYALDPWTADLNTNLENYYKFEEASGAVIDELEDANLTNNGADTQQTGKIGYSYYYDGGTDYLSGSYGSRSFSEITIACWYNGTSPDSYGGVVAMDSTDFYYRRDASSSNTMFSAVGGYYVPDLSASVNGTWVLGVGTWSDSDDTMEFWVNNISQGTDTGASGAIVISSSLEVGRNEGNNLYSWKGHIDECGIWSRRLTDGEIGLLWNDGDGVTYTTDFGENATAELVSPANSTTYTVSPITINHTCYAYDDINLANVSFYHNSTLDQTNTTGLNATNYTFSKSLEEGVHNWYCIATDNESRPGTSETWEYIIDATPPQITINEPDTSDKVTFSLPYNVTINTTVTDTRPDTCWYHTSDDATNITYSCSALTNATFSTGGTKTIYVWANDTAGNENMTSVSFLLNYVVETVTYTPSISEGDTHDILLNITATSVTSFNGNLTYNYTTYEGSNNYNSTAGGSIRTLTAPTVSSSEVIPFNWTYDLNGVTYNTIIYNQTINFISPLNVTTASCTDKALVFYLEDETNLTNVTGNIDYNFEFGPQQNSSLKNLYGSITNTTYFYVCVNATALDPYYIGYGELQYGATGYVDRRYYFFENSTISNSTYNARSLRNLLSTDQTSFVLTMEDTDLNVYNNHYTAMWRWYPDLNAYQIVEMGKTDVDGETVAHVRTEDVDYRVGLYMLNGTLINLDSPRRFVCTSSPCSLTIRVDNEELDLTGFYDVVGNLDYNETTQVFTYTYNDPNQYTDTMRLVVERLAGDNVLIICDTSSSGFSGVLSCNASLYSGTLKASVYRTASPSVPIAQKIIQTTQTVFNSAFGLIISMFIWLAIALTGFGGNPIITIIFAIIGLLPALILGSINMAIFTGFAVLGAIVIHFVKRAVAV